MRTTRGCTGCGLQRRLKTYAFVPFENDEAVPRKASAKESARPPLSKDQAAAKITAVCRALRARARVCVSVYVCSRPCARVHVYVLVSA